MATVPPWIDVAWLGPSWLERQSDPDSSSFVPGTWLGPSRPGPGTVGGATVADPVPTPNCTHRRATSVGSLWTTPRALVDDRGLVVPHGHGWSLDWWVRAEDRWHHPSRTRGTRQRLVGRAPVVETAVRVPGGDVVQRVAGILDGDGGPAVLVEIENGSAVPVAIAIAVRPYDLLGAARVRQVSVDAGRMTVDGRVAVRFTRPPADVVTGSAATGDPAARVGEAPGERAGDRPMTIEDESGWASAVAVFPLAHTATLSVVVPLAGSSADPTPSSRRGRRRSAAAVAPADAAPAPTGSGSGSALVEPPTAEQVAKGWDVQLRRGLQVELPDQKLDEAFHAARAQLLLLAGSDGLAVDQVAARHERDLPMIDAAEIVTALTEAGFTDEAAAALRRWPAWQAPDGAFDPDGLRMGANGAALGAVADHWRLTRDTALVDDLVTALAKGAHWLATRRTSRRAPREHGADGLLPDDAGGPDIGGPGTYPRDSAAAARALRALAPAEESSGQPEVAEDARALAAALDDAVERWVVAGGGPIPAAVGRPVDAGIVASLDLVADADALGPDDHRMRATVDRIRTELVHDGLVVRALDRSGTDPAATLRLAQVAIAAADRRALADLEAVIAAAGPTVSWPTVVNPRTGGGSAGRLHDPVVTARFVRTVRRLLVRELPRDAGLALCSVVPESWWGQALDVRDAPTAFGRCSFSIRWHGERPALLWELDPHDGVGPVTITAPGLDPSWSTTEPSGEALLAAPVAAPVEPPEAAATDDGAPGAPVEATPADGSNGEVAVDLRRDPRPGGQARPGSVDGGESFL